MLGWHECRAAVSWWLQCILLLAQPLCLLVRGSTFCLQLRCEPHSLLHGEALAVLDGTTQVQAQPVHDAPATLLATCTSVWDELAVRPLRSQAHCKRARGTRPSCTWGRRGEQSDTAICILTKQTNLAVFSLQDEAVLIGFCMQAQGSQAARGHAQQPGASTCLLNAACKPESQHSQECASPASGVTVSLKLACPGWCRYRIPPQTVGKAPWKTPPPLPGGKAAFILGLVPSRALSLSQPSKEPQLCSCSLPRPDVRNGAGPYPLCACTHSSSEAGCCVSTASEVGQHRPSLQRIRNELAAASLTSQATTRESKEKKHSCAKLRPVLTLIAAGAPGPTPNLAQEMKSSPKQANAAPQQARRFRSRLTAVGRLLTLNWDLPQLTDAPRMSLGLQLCRACCAIRRSIRPETRRSAAAASMVNKLASSIQLSATEQELFTLLKQVRLYLLSLSLAGHTHTHTHTHPPEAGGG